MRKEGSWGEPRGLGRQCWPGPHALLPPFQVVASVVDQDSFSGFAPLQPQVRQPPRQIQVSGALWGAAPRGG